MSVQRWLAVPAVLALSAVGCGTRAVDRQAAGAGDSSATVSAPPTTYVENQPSSPGRCWFVTAVVDGAWTAPNGIRPSCVDKVLDQK
jgi:hypothetical protein